MNRETLNLLKSYILQGHCIIRTAFAMLNLWLNRLEIEIANAGLNPMDSTAMAMDTVGWMDGLLAGLALLFLLAGLWMLLSGTSGMGK
jgi:hypothetical protein